MFKVWCSLCFSKTVHHITFKLGIGVNKICFYLYYSTQSHWFKFFPESLELWVNSLCSHLAVKLKFLCWDYLSETIGLCTVERSIMEWPCLSVCLSIRPSTIAFEHDISKTAYLIDFIFWYSLNTIKISDAIDLGYSTKIKMATTAVWILTFTRNPKDVIIAKTDVIFTKKM